MKCINCYREIADDLKFCTFCGTKQPDDREAYEREHPELAEAISIEELLEQQKQEEEERLKHEEAQRKAQEEAEFLSQDIPPMLPNYQEGRLGQPPKPSYSVGGDQSSYGPHSQHVPNYQPPAHNNLIPCPECGRLVSPRAYSCPQCGFPISNMASARPQPQPVVEEKDDKGSNGLWIILIIIGILALLFIAISIKGCSNGTTDYSSTSDSASAVPSAESVMPNSMTDEEPKTEERVDSTKNASSNFNCHSEDLPSNDLGGDMGTDLDEKSVSISKTWLEHDADGGIRIHAEMNTSNLLDYPLEVRCRFWFEDGRPIKSTDRLYETREHQICTSTNVTPNYQECYWEDLKLWIPYTQIKRVKDWKHLKCRVEVLYRGHCLATSNYMHFGCWLE